MMEQIEKRMGSKPEEVLVDGGFTSKEAVNDVSGLGVTLYGPSGQRKWKTIHTKSGRLILRQCGSGKSAW